jgi:hypothetical protein
MDPARRACSLPSGKTLAGTIRKTRLSERGAGESSVAVGCGALTLQRSVPVRCDTRDPAIGLLPHAGA